MLRMSILEHLEELRARIIKALYGFGAIFLVCLYESDRLFDIVMAPGWEAMRRTGIRRRGFHRDRSDGAVSKSSMCGRRWWRRCSWLRRGFCGRCGRSSRRGYISGRRNGRFRSSWARRDCFCWAESSATSSPFVTAWRSCWASARDVHVLPLISIEDYFDRFVDMMLGIGVAFELPVLLFFLTLLRVVSPGFLLSIRAT